MTETTAIRIGTRKSALAMWQAEHVAGLLRDGGFLPQIVSMETKGDRMLGVAIAGIGSKGVFTEELEQALRDGEIDLAVHSAKDLASELPDGFSILAFTKREPSHDILVSHRDLRLNDRVKGLIIGTSSTRRKAMLRHYYPGAEHADIRGNLQTRIAKMERGDCDALMLAYAGVRRMGYLHLLRQEFDTRIFTPAAGQGSLAIEIYHGMNPLIRLQIRRCLNHPETEAAISTERAFLKALHGGCSIPAFALATLHGREIEIRAGIYSLDGKRCVHLENRGSALRPARLGRSLGLEVLRRGGKEILHQIRRSTS